MIFQCATTKKKINDYDNDKNVLTKHKPIKLMKLTSVGYLLFKMHLLHYLYYYSVVSNCVKKKH